MNQTIPGSSLERFPKMVLAVDRGAYNKQHWQAMYGTSLRSEATLVLGGACCFEAVAYGPLIGDESL